MDDKKYNFKIEKAKRVIKRIFPNWFTEIAISLTILACILFASQPGKTATLDNELSLMKKPENVVVELEKDEPEIHADFEINQDTNVKETVITYPESQMCFIGDSRTYAIQTSVVSDASFIAKSSQGLAWFLETAKPSFEKIKDNINICIVLLGINDIRNVDKYITELNTFAEQYPDKIMVYANLGPVDESRYKGIPNTSLVNFNNKMEAGLSDRWQIIDLHSYLLEEKFSSSDGLHYSAKDSVKIYNFIVDSVKKQTIKEIIK